MVTPKAHLPTDELVLITDIDNLTGDMLDELDDGEGGTENHE